MESQRIRLLEELYCSNTPLEGMKHLCFPGLEFGSSAAPQASRLVLPESEIFYRLSADQITVPKGETGDYDISQFSDQGVELYRQSAAKSSSPECSCIQDYTVGFYASGPWYADPRSPHHLPDHFHLLNTWSNAVICGWIEGGSGRREIMTDSIILYTNTWCVDRTGAVYRLGKK